MAILLVSELQFGELLYAGYLSSALDAKSVDFNLHRRLGYELCNDRDVLTKHDWLNLIVLDCVDNAAGNSLFSIVQDGIRS